MADEKYKELIPPEGDEEVGKVLFGILSEIVADKVNLGLHDKWMRNYELRRNKHWKSKSSAQVPLISANLLFTHIQRTANTMTDNNPTFNVAQVGAIDEDQKQMFTDLQRCTEHWWIDQEQQDRLESSVLNGEDYGIAIEKVIFNADLEYGLGEVETVIVDPFHFGWYPLKLRDPRDIQKSDALLHYYPVSIRELKRKYPKFADKIKADTDVLKELGDDRREISSQSGTGKSNSLLISISSVVKQVINFLPGKEPGESDQTVVVEGWVHDYTMENTGEPVIDAQGRTIQEQKPKYPGFIRYLKACNAGKLVLEDKPNPNINPVLLESRPEEAQKTYLYDKFPFCVVNSVKDTANAWGISDMEQLEQLMMEINKSLSQLVLEKDRSARRKIINPRDSGVRNEDFTNYPSILNPTTAQTGSGIRYLELPPASVDIIQSIDLLKGLFFLVSGTFELDQAQVAGREVIAYKAIAALLERSATMMRGKIRAYSRMIRERGRMYLSHVMNFYTEERWITYTDEVGQETAKPITGSNMIFPAKLTVVSGSTMPISKIQQREEALALYKEQAIDREELLDKLDWSNRANVLKRIAAGPINSLTTKLEAIGAPPEVLQFLTQLSMMDDKKFKLAVKQGEVPPFQQIVETLAGGNGQPKEDPLQQAEIGIKQIDYQKGIGELAKLDAERALITEKIMTERVDQQVKLAGVSFDSETLKMERMKLTKEIDAQDHDKEMEEVKTGLDIAAKKSEHELEREKIGAQVAISKQKNRPGFNEKGMRSNNKKIAMADELKAKPKWTFNPEGEGYDYESARKAGLKPDETGHWPSREPKSGLLLKGRGHETWGMTEEGEAKAGYEIYKNDGRYYSRPKSKYQKYEEQQEAGPNR